MTFVTRNLMKVADNVFGLDRPNPAASMPPTNTAIPTSTLMKAKNDNINVTGDGKNRGDALGAFGGGQTGIALDPLGRRGAGYTGTGKTMLGR
jgi:hypothetical protein